MKYNMATWVYNGEKYKTESVDWKNINLKEDLLVYNPKWDKVFILLTLGIYGNGTKLKACIKDIYTKKYYWVCAKELELVIKT